jgi:hypothetical protein
VLERAGPSHHRAPAWGGGHQPGHHRDRLVLQVEHAGRDQADEEGDRAEDSSQSTPPSRANVGSACARTRAPAPQRATAATPSSVRRLHVASSGHKRAASRRAPTLASVPPR